MIDLYGSMYFVFVMRPKIINVFFECFYGGCVEAIEARCDDVYTSCPPLSRPSRAFFIAAELFPSDVHKIYVVDDRVEQGTP
jgi:hypothetical protein